MAKAGKKVERRKLHIRTGDMVLVISGEDRSKTPRKVLGVFSNEGKVVVEGVNVMKDSQKQNQQQGGAQASTENFIEKPYPIDASNVALIDPKSGAPTRIRLQVGKDGKRQRIAVKSGEVV